MGFLEERATWERNYWLRLLAKHRGNIAQVARESGFCRTNIYKIIQRLNIATAAPPGRRGNGAWRSLEK